MLANVSVNPEEVHDDVEDDVEEDDVEDDVEEDDGGDDVEDDGDDNGQDGEDGEDLEDLEEDDEEGEDLFSILEYFFVEQKKNRNIVDVLLEMKRSLDTHNKLLLEILKKK
ncbi:hypothetical protein CYMTET_31790 [Cymbomonas tetramitiformis]|uniref:Uncharacterized protein n=1 Tax=Cymbomonas tetramitiformis TaxID=36881 RepID=A0AAE0KSJ3_9CHLO|nr:hypothetical protein CYMTET_31790 [Cymbomonas tetramitiformis]